MRDAIWMAGGWTILHLLWIGCVFGALTAVAARILRAERPTVRYGAALFLLIAWSAAPIVIFGLVYEPAGTHSANPLTVADKTTSHSPGDHGAATAEQLGRSSNSPWDMESLAAITPWIWLSGAALTFAWLVFGLVGVGRLSRRAEPINDPVLLAILDRGRQALCISRKVAMATCATLKSPVLAGIFKPIILLPPGLALGLSPVQMEMVILHELAHIRRWDNCVNLLQRIVECALFFHPFTWWLSRHLRREREHCCDALVVSQTGRPRTYARTLLQLTSPQRLSPALVPMAERDVVERVRRILSNRKPRPMISIRLLVVLGVATCLLTILVPAISQTPTSTARTYRSSIHSSKSENSGYVGIESDALGVFIAANCTDCHTPSPALTRMAKVIDYKHAHELAQSCNACHQVPDTGNWPWDMDAPKKKSDDKASLRKQIEEAKKELERAMKRLKELERKLDEEAKRRKNG